MGGVEGVGMSLAHPAILAGVRDTPAAVRGKPCSCYGAPINMVEPDLPDMGFKCGRCGHRWPKDSDDSRALYAV